MENAMTKNVPRSLPSTNPLYSFNPIIYKAPPSEDDLEALKKPLTPITPEKINKGEIQKKHNFQIQRFKPLKSPNKFKNSFH